VKIICKRAQWSSSAQSEKVGHWSKVDWILFHRGIRASYVYNGYLAWYNV